MCPGSYIFLPPYIKHDIRAFMAIFILTFLWLLEMLGLVSETMCKALQEP